MSGATEGSKVKIHFSGKTHEGQEFDSTKEEGPITVEIGKGEFLPAIESALIGMLQGEKKTIVVSESEGIPYREELVFDVQKGQLPEDLPLEEGIMLQMGQPDGTVVFVKVLSVGDEMVKLDANHPLAGQVLTFDIELVEII